MSDKHTYCIIMAGGIGSRFWPMSRTENPKQFLDFLGSGRTLIQQTF
ncbi:MAG: sugar phosphate nucleotidyltransferase, partial [Flavobacteriales bacterium]